MRHLSALLNDPGFDHASSLGCSWSHTLGEARRLARDGQVPELSALPQRHDLGHKPSEAVIQAAYRQAQVGRPPSFRSFWPIALPAQEPA